MSGNQIVERHDYRPFGEEIGAGTGLRTTTPQGYSVSNPIRQQYAMTERDSPTGLNHTWFRKSDSSSGRWTSPDPNHGSMSIGDPQSTNRYAYVENDPVNSIDPAGLELVPVYGWACVNFESGDHWVHDCEPYIAGYVENGSGFMNNLTSWLQQSPNITGRQLGNAGSGNNRPTAAQCNGIRELLRREKQQGTENASKMSSNTFGSNPIDALHNRHGNIPMGNGKELDADWLIDLNTSYEAQYMGMATLKYTIGKTIWVVGKKIRGQAITNPVPFYSDPGERAAVGYAESASSYSGIFTAQWMKENCP